MSTGSGSGVAEDSIPAMTRIPGYDVAFPREQAAKNIWKPATWQSWGPRSARKSAGWKPRPS